MAAPSPIPTARSTWPARAPGPVPSAAAARAGTLVNDLNPLTYTSSCSVTYTPPRAPARTPSGPTTTRPRAWSTRPASGRAITVHERRRLDRGRLPDLAGDEQEQPLPRDRDRHRWRRQVQNTDGSVDFSRTGAGTGAFSGGGACTLVNDLNPLTYTDSCSVTYTPASGAGTHTVRGQLQRGLEPWSTRPASGPTPSPSTSAAPRPRSTARPRWRSTRAAPAAPSSPTPMARTSPIDGSVDLSRTGAGTGAFSGGGACTLVNDLNPLASRAPARSPTRPPRAPASRTPSGPTTTRPRAWSTRPLRDRRHHRPRAQHLDRGRLPDLAGDRRCGACTVTMTDTDGSAQFQNTDGSVDFSRTGAGTGAFSGGGACTLVNDLNPLTYTSSCSVTYTPASGAGTPQSGPTTTRPRAWSTRPLRDRRHHRPRAQHLDRGRLPPFVWRESDNDVHRNGQRHRQWPEVVATGHGHIRQGRRQRHVRRQNPCTLAKVGVTTTSNCSVTSRPTAAAGTHTITARIAGTRHIDQLRDVRAHRRQAQHLDVRELQPPQ